MQDSIDPTIQHIVLRTADDDQVRSDTASVIEREDGTLLVAYHSYGQGLGVELEEDAVRRYEVR